jgi:GTP-binding protein HflX
MGNAVVVKRVEPREKPDDSEIISLAKSAGYNVVGSITQSRTEDYEYNIGEGAVAKLHHMMKERDANTAIIDNELDSYQIYNIGVYLSNNTEVLDRYKTILRIFEDRASTKEAKLQIELARLRYELPRVEVKSRL